MQANRSRDTSPEKMLRKLLWHAGLRGYRLNVAKLPGKPDVVFCRAKIAIFLHGCWWHGCPRCGRYRLPKTNSSYWKAKLDRNQARDIEVVARLEALRFEVIVVWECELKEDSTLILEKIRLAVRHDRAPIPLVQSRA